MAHRGRRLEYFTIAATKRGWHKLAGLLLKVAAAAPLAAKILVGVEVLAVAVTIYYVIRAA